MKNIFNVILIAFGIGAAVGQAATLEDLMKADRAFNRMAQNEGVREAFLAFVGDNPTMLAEGLDPITGDEAVGEFLAGWPDGVSITWEPQDGRLAESGDLGYTWGTFVSRGNDAEGEEVVKYGKYVTVWALQGDGTWKWVIDIGNPSPTP
jgi:ketosteroid isomerase-like protein